jgi:hypothetical protein
MIFAHYRLLAISCVHTELVPNVSETVFVSIVRD